MSLTVTCSPVLQCVMMCICSGECSGANPCEVDFSKEPPQLQWWQISTYRGCKAYFRCLSTYLSLLVSTKNVKDLIDLYQILHIKNVEKELLSELNPK